MKLFDTYNGLDVIHFPTKSALQHLYDLQTRSQLIWLTLLS